MNENKVTAGTLARTIVLIVALLNSLFALVGLPALGIEENVIYEVVSLLFTIGASLVAWWRNNSFTAPAIAADKYAALHARQK